MRLHQVSPFLGVAGLCLLLSAHPRAGAAIGYTDGFNASGCKITGWANDPDTSTFVTVKVYRSGEINNGGQLLGQTLADTLRGDGLRGYSFSLPSGFDDEVFAYAEGLGSNGVPNGTLVLLPLYTPEVPARHVTCDTALDGEELGDTSDFPTLGFSVTLGAIQPLMDAGDAGIAGGSPDTRMSAHLDGQMRIFFSCHNGVTEQSCLAEPSSVAAFQDLSSIWQAGHTVMSGAVPGDPYQSQYAALASTWRDPVTGIAHGWYHAEIPVPGCSRGQYASIGYASSFDGGHTFTKYGPVVTSPLPLEPNSRCGQGVGEPNVIAHSDGYLYMLYEFTDPLNAGNGGLSLARASQAQPNVWYKYGPKDDGSNYTTAGLGGEEHPVIPIGNHGQQSWMGSVSYNTYLERFVLLHSDYNHDGSVYVRTSKNLISWTAPQLAMPATAVHAYHYPALIGPDGDHVVGQSGWLFVARKTAFGPALLARRSMEFSK